MCKAKPNTLSGFMNESFEWRYERVTSEFSVKASIHNYFIYRVIYSFTLEHYKYIEVFESCMLSVVSILKKIVRKINI